MRFYYKFYSSSLNPIVTTQLKINSFATSKSVRTKMEESKVVPDVIDSTPPAILSVKYENVQVDLGNVLTPTQVQNPPTVSWIGDAKKFYTICMTDPDAPSRNNPIAREWHHWLVGNIPGTDIEKGTVLTEYVGAGPPKGTGLHRYVILVYEQPGKLTFEEKHLRDTCDEDHLLHGNFSIRKFATKYKLNQAIAGNFFLAEWDDYVALLYKRRGH